MISLEISMVERNRAESARLAVAMAEFESRGGLICTLPGVGFIPRTPMEARPYGRTVSAKPKTPPPIRTKRAVALAAKAQAKHEATVIVRGLAETMTMAEVSRETGISGYMLRKLATDAGFEYQQFDPTPSLKPNTLDRSNDAENVQRIINARNLGLCRKQARDFLSMSNTLMHRLIDEYAIDFPLQRIRKK